MDCLHYHYFLTPPYHFEILTDYRLTTEAAGISCGLQSHCRNRRFSCGFFTIYSHGCSGRFRTEEVFSFSFLRIVNRENTSLVSFINSFFISSIFSWASAKAAAPSLSTTTRCEDSHFSSHKGVVSSSSGNILEHESNFFL